jgi:SAM-dependent methyltransferase
MLGYLILAVFVMTNNPSFDSRSTLPRSDAQEVYDMFAEEGHAVGKDADSGYGGPAILALLELADFDTGGNVLDYGCGQGKLAELVLQKCHQTKQQLFWRGIDQSPRMV